MASGRGNDFDRREFLKRAGAVGAVAAGLPVVSTNIVGIPEIVEHGKTGLLVPPGNPMELAKSIVELLHKPDARESFGRAGRARAEKLFDLRKNVPALKAQFERSAELISP